MTKPECEVGHGELRPVYGNSNKINKKGNVVGEYSFWGCSHQFANKEYCKKTIPNMGEFEFDPEVLEGKKKESDPQEQMEEFVNDLDAEKKHEAQQQLDEVSKKEQEFVEDKPMTRQDWDIKDFVIGLGVFSSPARKEGMPPKEAFRDMHIWEWMDVAYGGGTFYEDWKERAKKRIK